MAGGEGQQTEPSELKPSPERSLGQTASPSSSCSYHYKETVNRYGSLLDNLGCICKILLSLNLKSCCILPNHATATAASKSLSPGTKMRADSAPSTSTTVMQGPEEFNGESCCANRPSATTKVAPESVSRCSGESPSGELYPPGSTTLSPNVVSGNDSRKTECFNRISKCRSSSARLLKTVSEEPSNLSKERPDEGREIHFSEKLLLPIQQVSTSVPAFLRNHPVTINNNVASTSEMSPSSSSKCSTATCCSHESSKISGSGVHTHITSNMQNHTAETGCCNKFPATPVTAYVASTVKMEDERISTNCGNRYPDYNIGMALPKSKRCAETRDQKAGVEVCQKNLPATQSEECCQGSSSTSISISPQTLDECLKKDCCASNLLPCDSDTDVSSTSPKPAFSRSMQGNDSVFKTTVKPNLDQMDVERVVIETQRIKLQVQGMTCTGCEKKLFRALTSLPEVSAVKTSLLLAQAEFSLQPSDNVDVENIASNLQEMTGFICTKIVQVGGELELIVGRNAQDYVDRAWPASIIDVTVLDRSRIRVGYLPKTIGARDLLNDPFFHSARLATPSPPALIASGRAHLWKSFFMTLFSSVCTIPVLVLAWAPLPEAEMLYSTVSLVLASIVQGVIAGPFYVSAFKTLFFSRMVEMDLLVVLSTTAAYTYSIAAYAYLIAGRPLLTGQYFETSTLLITLIMVGRTVSAYARQRAVESITIESLQPNTAVILDHSTGDEVEIDARLLQYQDIFKVLPDMSIVTDGVILTGESEVDESLITGELALIHKQTGSTVKAGTINHSGTLKVRVTRLPCENTIKTIATMVDDAKSSKPKIQELADRVASYFVPVILGLTLVVFIAWVVVEKQVRSQNTTTACITAMTYAISVLVVSCPCAIGLAVPMVVVIAGGVGARHGLIFRTAETVDTARKVSHVIFDKTGTLTQGKLHVIAQKYAHAPTIYESSLILGLTTNSTHPVSAAIASHLRSSGVEATVIDQITSHPGKGIETQWNNSTIRAGNPHWLSVQDHPSVTELLSSSLTIFCVTRDANLIAAYGLRDELRPDALSTVTTLRSRGIELSLLSGDNDSSVRTIASQLGILPPNVLARCSPAEKQAYVKSKLTPSSGDPRRSLFSLHRKEKQNIVLFCGDGTNDAPSLAQASIGLHIAPSNTSSIAGVAADAVIMRPSLHSIITLMDLSKAFHTRIVFNFFWSFVYNIFAVLLAAGAFVDVGNRGGIRIRPEYAGLGELISVLPVVLVAVGLRWRTF